MGGHCSWVGWGSELMSWKTLLWLTKVTLDPTATVMLLGLTPLFEMLTVVVATGGPSVTGGVELEGLELPQAGRTAASSTAIAARFRDEGMRPPWKMLKRSDATG